MSCLGGSLRRTLLLVGRHLLLSLERHRGQGPGTDAQKAPINMTAAKRAAAVREVTVRCIGIEGRFASIGNIAGGTRAIQRCPDLV